MACTSLNRKRTPPRTRTRVKRPQSRITFNCLLRRGESSRRVLFAQQPILVGFVLRTFHFAPPSWPFFKLAFSNSSMVSRSTSSSRLDRIPKFINVRDGSAISSVNRALVCFKTSLAKPLGYCSESEPLLVAKGSDGFSMVSKQDSLWLFLCILQKRFLWQYVCLNRGCGRRLRTFHSSFFF